VLAARAGDRDAFGALYTEHARLVHGILLANVRGDDVHDLVQDVFLTALRQLHTLRDPAAFGGWLVTIARNRARMHHRAARPSVALSDELPERGRADAALETADVLRALRSLPERYREPLTLRLVEEMSGEEIARHTGLTHGTVRVYLHHGMRLLRERLGATDV
jgi:RNA polymerase sigma-70 factor (ECF subfamily)